MAPPPPVPHCQSSISPTWLYRCLRVGTRGDSRPAAPGSRHADPAALPGGAERCSETQPSGAEVPGRRRGPHRKNEVEVGQRPSLLLTTSFSPWVADATPHPHPCLKRRPLFSERAPWAGPPRRPPRGPPHYADVAETGHFMPLPHLLRLADARVSTSRPKPHQPTRWYRCLDTPQCCLKASPPIATRLRRGGSPTSRPPPSPASHWTGMPRQPSHDAQRRVPLHIDARRARSLPSRPRLTVHRR